MIIKSLEDKVKAHPDVLTMMRNANIGFYVFPMKAEHTNWRDEQMAWANGAVLFDQSYHMTDVYIEGPDTLRLLADISINKWQHFAPLQAKQIVTVCRWLPSRGCDLLLFARWQSGACREANLWQLCQLYRRERQL